MTLLEKYLKRPYPVTLWPLPKNQGGGYLARFADFGPYVAQGRGDTADEAIADARDGMRFILEMLIDDGEPPPDPTPPRPNKKPKRGPAQPKLTRLERWELERG